MVVLLSLVFGLLAPIRQVPVGDGAGDAIHVQNTGVHAITVALGAADAPGEAQAVAGYGALDARLQCAGPEGSLPALTAVVDGRPQELTGRPIQFPDGPPALWISEAQEGRAALEGLLRGPQPRLRLQHLAPRDVPDGLDGLRFAPVVLADGAALGRLSEAQRAALRDSVLAGAVLVVSVATEDAPAAALEGLSACGLGPGAGVGRALAAALPQATALRALRPEGRCTARLKADGAPVLVAAGLGLGEVRVLGVAFSELSPGAVADAALGPGPDGFAQALAWLGEAPPLGEARGVRWSVWVWASLGLLACLGLIARRWPRLALTLAVPGWVAAVSAPPVARALSVDQERVLVIADGGYAIAVGSVDLTLGVGGGRTLPTAGPEVALEDAQPQGGCLVRSATAGLVLAGEPGDRRRITWLARVSPATGGATEAHFPAWPPGPLAGQPVAPLVAAEAPALLQRQAALREAWVVAPQHVVPDPVILRIPEEP